MSDEVGVDPERLAQAASALEALRDALAANVPVIVNTLNEYWSASTGAPVGLAPLQQAVGKSVDDAASMRSRANLAQAYMTHAVNIGVVVAGKAYIPWNTKEVDAADAQLRAKERAEYQDGARLAKALDKTGNYSGAAWLLAQRAKEPYFTAGLLDNLNTEQIQIIMTWPNSAFPPPSRTDPAIVTAMADGTLSSRTMRELMTWLTSMTANFGGNQFRTDPLLQAIAENGGASARLIAFIDPTRQPQGSAQIENLLETYADCGAENSILQIMANAIYAARPQQSMALIKSLVGDLSVLDSSTIAQSGPGLSAFMKAAAARLMPGIPNPNQIANPHLLDNWYNRFSDNLQVLTPLLNSIGSAFQGHVEEVMFWRGFYEGVFIGAAFAAIPLGGLPMGAAMAVGGAESAITAEIQPYLDKGFSYLFPAGEDGGEAHQSYYQNLQKIVIVAGVVRVYTGAGDKAEAEWLLKNPKFYKAVNSWVTYGNRSSYDGWLDSQGVRLPGGQSYTLQDIVASLANSVDPGTFS